MKKKWVEVEMIEVRGGREKRPASARESERVSGWLAGSLCSPVKAKRKAAALSHFAFLEIQFSRVRSCVERHSTVCCAVLFSLSRIKSGQSARTSKKVSPDLRRRVATFPTLLCVC